MSNFTKQIVVVSIVLGLCISCIKTDDEISFNKQEAVIVINGINRYKSENGENPETLNDLIPNISIRSRSVLKEDRLGIGLQLLVTMY
jgi:hypothetical protein